MPRRLLLLLAVLTALIAAPVQAADASARADRAVAWAAGQIGHREDGRSNCSAKIIRWQRAMGFRSPPCRPWCGAFVHQAILKAGIKLSARLIDPAKTARDAAAGVRGVRRISLGSVRKGDILLFAFSRRPGVASHMALVRGRPRNGRVYTYEGNVAHRSVATSRLLRIAVMAVRVDGLQS